MTEGAWTAIIVALLTAGGGLITAVQAKRKVDADSESVSVSTMQSVLTEVRVEMERARLENERCHQERAEVLQRLRVAESRIASLENYMRLNHGINPEELP